MIKTIFFAFGILFFSFHGYSQKGLEDWDIKYKLKDITELIEFEANYARKIEADTSTAQYYIRLESYRFLGYYTGIIRPISNESYNSLFNVYRLKYGDTSPLENIISKNSSEVGIKVNDKVFWMPIQDILIEPFNNEVKENEEVLLYTLFTNEHTQNKKTINTFLISEFTAYWEM